VPKRFGVGCGRHSVADSTVVLGGAADEVVATGAWLYIFDIKLVNVPIDGDTLFRQKWLAPSGLWFGSCPQDE
jgi:hypothetical protein